MTDHVRCHECWHLAEFCTCHPAPAMWTPGGEYTPDDLALGVDLAVSHRGQTDRYTAYGIRDEFKSYPPDRASERSDPRSAPTPLDDP